jgi:uncharacterized protein YggE
MNASRRKVPAALGLVPIMALVTVIALVVLSGAPIAGQSGGAEPAAGGAGLPSPPAPQPAFRLPPAVTVAGRGEVRVAPDQAIVRLGVEAHEASARAAQEAANRMVAAVLQAVYAMGGVRAEAIQTSELTLSPTYAPVPRPQPGETPQAPRVSGYQASNVVSITLEKLDQVGPLIDAGLAAGANRLEGIAFGLRHDEAARQAALRQAVGEAQQKAAVLAQAMRMRLGEVIDLEEEGVAAVQPQPRMEALRMSAAAAATPVSSGELAVTAGVVIRYRLSPCPASGPCGDSH